MSRLVRIHCVQHFALLPPNRSTERPPSQASNSKEDEEEEGFEDPAAVLEHWTIKSGGQLQPRDDPRFQTLTKLAGGPTAGELDHIILRDQIILSNKNRIDLPIMSMVQIYAT